MLLRELMARVRTQLRRSRPSAAGQTLRYENITLDTERHRVSRAEEELNLAPTEYHLLVMLMKKPGRVFTGDQLLDHVWGCDIYVDTCTVDATWHVGARR